MNRATEDGGGLSAELPTTSLIIGTRNRPQLVLECVRSVLQGEETPTEIVVIDQSDVVNAALQVWPPDQSTLVHYLWQPGRGVSLGRNIGIACSAGEALVFLDDDMLVTADWFGRMVRELARRGYRAVITGRVVAGEAESPGGFAPSVILDTQPAVYGGRPGKDLLFPNMALFRSAVDEVGGYDERLGPGTRFPSSEDNDLGFRLLEAGYRIAYCPNVVVIHRAWRRPAALMPLRWAYGRGQGAYFAKYASLSDTYMLNRMVKDVGRHLLGIPRIVWRDPKAALGDVVYSLGVLSGAGHWLWSHRQMTQKRSSPGCGG